MAGQAGPRGLAGCRRELIGRGREDSRMQVTTGAFPADAEQCAMLSASLGSQQVALCLLAPELAEAGPEVTKQRPRGTNAQRQGSPRGV